MKKDDDEPVDRRQSRTELSLFPHVTVTAKSLGCRVSFLDLPRWGIVGPNGEFRPALGSLRLRLKGKTQNGVRGVPSPWRRLAGIEIALCSSWPSLPIRVRSSSLAISVSGPRGPRACFAAWTGRLRISRTSHYRHRCCHHLAERCLAVLNNLHLAAWLLILLWDHQDNKISDTCLATAGTAGVQDTPAGQVLLPLALPRSPGCDCRCRLFEMGQAARASRP
jgi:hypothetical protein